ncbi:putative lipoprotein [Thalassoporum mexicanum PCC 7367]|uniref:hypothetical protein n=1 Tax=Thalassoporum mexicanum TaxID=3457544 RepID=UPI00029FD446|nr:hypothetical protein [Pseudanabaena sp. PCC 7367]AFY70855.1 putative lipoprotein [Pseudanabaena sp. PCC 7367]
MLNVVRELRLGGLLIAIALATLALTGCGQSSLKLEPDPIAQQLPSNSQDSLILANAYTQLDWDRVYIFAPYTSIDQINESLGYAWATDRTTTIYQSDRISLLVFTKAGQVVGYVEYPRSRGDFAGLARDGGYSTEEAVFMADYTLSNQAGPPMLLVDE